MNIPAKTSLKFQTSDPLSRWDKALTLSSHCLAAQRKLTPQTTLHMWENSAVLDTVQHQGQN